MSAYFFSDTEFLTKYKDSSAGEIANVNIFNDNIVRIPQNDKKRTYFVLQIRW